MAADFSAGGSGSHFPPTRRSAVLEVRSDDPIARARSFDILVRAYWKPAYKHVRVKWRREADAAADLTQGFFTRAFEKRYFTNYEPGKALFRLRLQTLRGGTFDVRSRKSGVWRSRWQRSRVSRSATHRLVP